MTVNLKNLPSIIPEVDIVYPEDYVDLFTQPEDSDVFDHVEEDNVSVHPEYESGQENLTVDIKDNQNLHSMTPEVDIVHPEDYVDIFSRQEDDDEDFSINTEVHPGGDYDHSQCNELPYSPKSVNNVNPKDSTTIHSKNSDYPGMTPVSIKRRKKRTTHYTSRKKCRLTEKTKCQTV